MKKILTIFGGVFLALIPVYVTYYLNRNEPDLRYTLSAPIPVDFSATTEKLVGGVQQLDVRNVGASAAKKIVVKISGEVTTYRIQKASEADNVQVYSQGGSFELDYPELPPQAGFKLVFV